MRTLIVGLQKSEAGKTTVAQALLFYLRERGLNACGFKPKASNTIWYDYEVVCEALSQGRLYGSDSKLLKKASGTDLPEEVINPIHRLWAVTPVHLIERMGELPHFIVDRVTLCNDGLKGLVVVNDSLPFKHGREKLVKNLYKSEAEVLHVRSLTKLNEVIGKYYERAVETAHNCVTAKHDAIVYESYSDIALPWEGIKDLDLVLAVEPGYIHAYEPNRYIAATNLQTRLIREVSAKSLIKLLKPVKTIRVPPYRSGEIVEKIKRKLRPFLDLKLKRGEIQDSRRG